MTVDRGRHGPPLGDRPDDERLPPGGVTRGEHAGHVGGETGVTRDGAAGLHRQPQLVDEPVLPVGPGEAEGEQHEVGGERPPGAIHRAAPRVHLDQVQRPHMPLRVAVEAQRGRREQPRVRVGDRSGPQITGLLVRGGQPVDPYRIRRPGLGVLVALRLRQRVDVQLRHGRGTLPDGRAQAVRPGVAAADDDDVLPGGRQRGRLQIARAHPVGKRKVLHSLVNPRQLPPRHGQFAPRGRPRGEHHGVVSGPKLIGPDVPSDRRRRTELGPLGQHLLQPPLKMVLLHLELGDAVAHQPARPVGPLVHGDRVPGPGQLLGRGQPGGPRTDHRDRLAGQPLRRPRRREALLPRPVGDRALDVLDGDGRLVDRQHTPRLARRRAQPAGELREIVRGVQPVGGRPPVLPRHQVVPLGDQVAQRAGVVAEGDAAVHAAIGLLADDRQQRPGDVDLVPVPHPLLYRPPRPVLAGRGHESLGIGHGRLPCVRV